MSRLSVCCRRSPARGRELAGELLRAGIGVVDGADGGGCDARVVFFDAAEPALFDEVRELSREGIERVLAIATSPAALGRDATWNLLHAGASDAFAWDPSGSSAEKVAARVERWSAVDTLVRSPLVRKNLIGQSAAWISTLRQVVEVAAFSDSSVLLLGESGTGKELLASLIHSLDPRPHKRELVILDCTTVVPELSGSEFFGHERGAFTGALSGRDGAFALAHAGTLFLDEVGELPPGLQAQLLRVVQEGTYKRVGGNQWHRTDFRLICATNRDLGAAVAEGGFRQDLFYRIARRTCRIPPLRERTQDILPLAEHFLSEGTADDEPLGFDASLREYLVARGYAGNVRELKQLVNRVRDRHVGPGPITAGDIPPDELPASGALGHWPDGAFLAAICRAVELGTSLDEIRRAAVDTAIRVAVEAEGGSLQRAARKLGVTDRALQLRRAQRGLSAEAS
jgi:transcriptional regulator with GAF, ATPase, and Fis domain